MTKTGRPPRRREEAGRQRWARGGCVSSVEQRHRSCAPPTGGAPKGFSLATAETLTTWSVLDLTVSLIHGPIRRKASARKGFGQTRGTADAHRMVKRALARRTTLSSADMGTARRDFPMATSLAPMRPTMPLQDRIYDRKCLYQVEMPDRETLRSRMVIEDIASLGDHPPVNSATNTPSMRRATPEHPMNSTSVRVAGPPRAPAPGTRGGWLSLMVITVVLARVLVLAWLIVIFAVVLVMREWGLLRGGIAAADLFPLTSSAATREIHLARAMSYATTAAAGAPECRRRNGRGRTYLAIGRRRSSDPTSRGGSTSALAHLCGHSRRPGCICLARAGHAAAASTPCHHTETLVSAEFPMSMTELEGVTRRLGPQSTSGSDLVKFEGTAKCLGPRAWLLMEKARARKAAAAIGGRPLDLVFMHITGCAAPMLSGTPWMAPMVLLDAT